MPPAQPEQDIYVKAALAAFFVLCFALNTFAYCAKAILWTRGYPTWAFWHSNDSRNFATMIAAEADPETRRRYSLFRFAYRVCFTLFFLVPVLLVALSYVTKYFQSP